LLNILDKLKMNTINALKIITSMENVCSKMEAAVNSKDNKQVIETKDLLLILQKQLQNEIGM